MHIPQLRELRELLAAFVARPLPGALVLGCRDEAMLYLVHALDTLDTDSPSDRFLLHFEPFDTADAWVEALVAHVASAGYPTPPPAEPLIRLRTVIATLLADLPNDDHRLVVALAPTSIADPAGFASLAEALLTDLHSPALRLVLRDDLADSRHFQTASTCPSEQVVAYRLEIPTSALIAATAATARNLSAPPELRAQSILQLGLLATAHGRPDEGVAACNAAIGLADDNLMLLALGFAFRADALRAQGNLEVAEVSARTALAFAGESRVLPTIHHAAMTLGEASRDLGRLDEAVACFELAEQAAGDPDARTLALERLHSLRTESHASVHPDRNF